jgi:hypothetical protein
VLGEVLQCFEIGQLGAVFPVFEVFSDFQAFPQQRDARLEFSKHRGNGGAFRFALRLLSVEGGELGALLRGLIEEKLPMQRNQSGGRSRRRDESGQHIGGIAERRAQPRDVELYRDKIACQVVALRHARRRVELDQHIARLYALAILHMDRTDDADFERLDGLGATGRDDLAGGRGDYIDLAPDRPYNRQAEEGDDRAGDGSARRRGRSLGDFERRRQEIVLVPAAAERRGS